MIRSVLTGKNGLKGEPRDGVAPDEALPLKLLVFKPVLDPAHALGRRTVVGQLEDAAEQDRNVLELGSGPLLDLGDDEMRQIGIGAAEVEMKFHRVHPHQTSRYGRMSSSNVQARQ
jgi:hypothetical protein